MTTTLFIQANDRPAEYSVSVKMYEAFLSSYKESHPHDSIVEVNLYHEQLPYLGNTMITGNYKVAEGMTLTPGEEAEQRIVRKHLEQFLVTDKIVIAFPLWNLTVPAVLHTYLDYMHQPRKTFKYTAKGLVGLLPDKKVALLNARGGVYAEHEELAVNFVKKHLRVFGIQDITTIVIEGHNQYPIAVSRLLRKDSGVRHLRQKCSEDGCNVVIEGGKSIGATKKGHHSDIHRFRLGPDRNG